MPATQTPLRYPGGKTKYAGLFVDVLKANGIKDCTFVEVFAGGAGAAIKLLLTGHVQSLFLNDLDVAIYAFWRIVKEQPGGLISLIKRTRISMAEWHRQKAVYEAKDTRNLLALAFATFFLNRCNHSGIIEARPIGGMEQSGKYRLNARFNKQTSIAKIKAIAKHADSISVFNMDGIAFLQHLQENYSARNCLIYFDPPYFQKGPDLYLNYFSYEDHLNLRNHILACPFSWVLSYDLHDEIMSLYEGHGYNLYCNRLRHTIAGNSITEELIISRLRMPDYLKQFPQKKATRRRML